MCCYLGVSIVWKSCSCMGEADICKKEIFCMLCLVSSEMTRNICWSEPDAVALPACLSISLDVFRSAGGIETLKKTQEVHLTSAWGL